MRLTKGFLSFLLGCELSCQSVLGTFRSWVVPMRDFLLDLVAILMGKGARGEWRMQREDSLVVWLVGCQLVVCL